jgi:hypothetical protein
MSGMLHFLKHMRKGGWTAYLPGGGIVLVSIVVWSVQVRHRFVIVGDDNC